MFSSLATYYVIDTFIILDLYQFNLSLAALNILTKYIP